MTEAHSYTDETGIQWSHPGKLEECTAPECQPVVRRMAETESEQLRVRYHLAVRDRNAHYAEKLELRAEIERLRTELRGAIELREAADRLRDKAERDWPGIGDLLGDIVSVVLDEEMK
jgi:hypothetical protein